MSEALPVRIKLNLPKENQVKGFYLLITHTHVYSDKNNEFTISGDNIKLLEDNGVDFEVVKRKK